jgi:thiol:disulfide interchange protein DsbC
MPSTALTFHRAWRLAARAALAAAAGAFALAAFANEAAIRKNLAERVPNLPPIDEVRATPVAGVFEVRYGGTELLYTDARGEFIFQGHLIEVRTLANLTEQRIEKLTAVDFDTLPLKDAIVIRQGTGARKLAVFGDPNCGYCKRFERDLMAVKDVTIYSFLLPILGPDSQVKSRNIWCAKDPARAWRQWMVDGVEVPRSMGACDTGALERNLAFGRKHRINGTPAVLFEDGTRRPGAIPAAEVERLLAAAAAPAKK